LKGGTNITKKRFLFSICYIFISSIFTFKLFYPIYISEEIIITYGINPFDICSKNPELWNIIKISYIFLFFTFHLIFVNFIYSKIFHRIYLLLKKNSSNTKHTSLSNNSKLLSNSELNLLIGATHLDQHIYIPESGLYQNFLITGTIGSGKTSSAMYPFTKQFLKFNYNNPDQKIGMLILDVKGNYYNQVKIYAEKYNLSDDIIVIELKSNTYYNPLHKPNLKPQVLANRLKTILLLFSENNSESYWLDKAEEIIAECIKLCRIYNDGYVTFLELHKLITIPSYYKSKINIFRDLYISCKLSNTQIYDLNASLDFFEKEFETLDTRTKGILVSEITRITNTFISDYDVKSTFCPSIQKLNFSGFDEAIKYGKIVVLNMNISEYRLLSKIVAAYLKLDFQTEVMSNLSKNTVKTTVFICDEYDKYVNKTDSEFFSMSREAKCINIISTQSYSSLKSNLKDDSQVKVITQNLINKIWFRSDDLFTIEEAQKQIGKEDKEKTSNTISENAKKTRFNYITNTLNSEDSSISETFNTYLQNDYIYDTNFFTQHLETFTALTFLSDGNTIFKPQKLNMFPHFKDIL